MMTEVMIDDTSGEKPKSVIIDPPSVIWVMKYEENITPIGCNPPKNAAEMPWNPISGGVEDNLQHVNPFCRFKVAAKPAKAPEIAVAIKMFLTLLMPA